MLEIDGEKIAGIKICNGIKFLLGGLYRSCTYNFDAESQWIEFSAVTKRPLTKPQQKIISIVSSQKTANLQKRKWSTFFKNKEEK